MADLRRWALGIEYDGAAFKGWQSQSAGAGVQDALEAALARVAGEPVRVHAAGRTDAGVHATGQVVHFDCRAPRPPRAWVLGTNSLAPEAVAVRWARPVAPDFHARFSALSRRYRYRILNREVRPALDAGRVAWVRGTLDHAAMHEAAQQLLGEHDFSAFRAAQCQSRTPMRYVSEILVRRRGDMVIVDIEANAFLHNMVRAIVGSLITVGSGQRDAAWLGEVLASRDRGRAGPTAPACGLCLVGVRYPARFGLPEAELPPLPALGLWPGAGAR